MSPGNASSIAICPLSGQEARAFEKCKTPYAGWFSVIFLMKHTRWTLNGHSVVFAEQKSRRAGRQYGRSTNQSNEGESHSDGTNIKRLPNINIKQPLIIHQPVPTCIQVFVQAHPAGDRADPAGWVDIYLLR